MLFEPLLKTVAARPNDIAMIDDAGKHTWAEFGTAVGALSKFIARVTEKETVGLLLPSGSAFAAAFYATMLAGKVAVPINFLLGAKEIAHIMADSGVDVVLSLPPLIGKLEGLPIKAVDVLQLPRPAAGDPGGQWTDPNYDPQKLACILYTSGTAGLPKGVELTYRNLVGGIRSCIEFAELKGSQMFLGIVPLFHSTGLAATLIAPVELGATMVFMGRFSAVATVKAIKEHNISVMAGVPSMYGMMARLKDAAPDDVQSLYAPLSGGEPLPANVRTAFEAKFHKPLLEGYGLTETFGPLCFNAPKHHRAGSVGKAAPGCEARIVSPETQQPLGTGEDGEVLLAGPQIMRGYHNNPEATTACLTADGFFRTGDLGHLDADGYLFITGRLKDLIISAGEKVHPREIEEVLVKHPAVADAAVIGKKDESRGEVVVAFVVAKEGQELTGDKVREFARASGMPQWQVPREVYIIADLPRSPTGKVLKRELVKQLND